jgi:hypothetical protein
MKCDPGYRELEWVRCEGGYGKLSHHDDLLEMRCDWSRGGGESKIHGLVGMNASQPWYDPFLGGSRDFAGMACSKMACS